MLGKLFYILAIGRSRDKLICINIECTREIIFVPIKCKHVLRILRYLLMAGCMKDSNLNETLRANWSWKRFGEVKMLFCEREVSFLFVSVWMLFWVWWKNQRSNHWLEVLCTYFGILGRSHLLLTQYPYSADTPSGQGLSKYQYFQAQCVSDTWSCWIIEWLILQNSRLLWDNDMAFEEKRLTPNLPCAKIKERNQKVEGRYSSYYDKCRKMSWRCDYFIL